jgi:hypothetical protein
LAALACAGLAACGGSGGDPVTADNIGSKYADALCAAESRCCQAQGIAWTASADQSCKLDAVFRPYVFQLVDSTFNADIADECLKAAARYDCTDISLIEDVCAHVFSQHVPLGGSCSTDTDCEQTPGAHALCPYPGTCVAAILFAGPGAACDPGTSEEIECGLTNGFWCSETSTSNPTSGMCAALSPIGGPCVSDAHCAAGAYCNAIPPSVCAPVKAVGDACNTNDGRSCGPFSICTNGVCAPPPAGICLAL